MQARLNLAQAAPDAVKAMRALSGFSKESGLEKSLIELINIRASQLNGCAFCLNMHTREARAAGESDERLHLVAAWRDAPVFSERERAALAWTEALTRLSPDGVADEIYDATRRHFSEAEMVKLSLGVAVINSWNRLMIGFRVPAQVETRR
ncbi:MAG TPA: carboxymuconolactone decarboxylase family protein [Alphaproteobacteria bacterium]